MNSSDIAVLGAFLLKSQTGGNKTLTMGGQVVFNPRKQTI
jgi:hypothetical protein